MTADELAKYIVGIADAADRCFLCNGRFTLNEKILLVPEDCSQTARMEAGEAYAYMPAHRACMERVP